jgi:hypothetical protein
MGGVAFDRTQMNADARTNMTLGRSGKGATTRHGTLSEVDSMNWKW